MVVKGDRKESINCGWMEALEGGVKGQFISVKFDCGFVRNNVRPAAFVTGNVRGSLEPVVGDTLKTTSDGAVEILKLSSRNCTVRFLDTGNVISGLQKDALLCGYVKDKISKAKRVKESSLVAAEMSATHIEKLRLSSLKAANERKRIDARAVAMQKAAKVRLEKEQKRKAEFHANAVERNNTLRENAIRAVSSVDFKIDTENPNDLNIDFKDRQGKWVLRFKMGDKFIQTRLGRFHNNMTQRVGRGKSYGDVIVSDEFMGAQQFCDWAVQQDGWGKGYHLEKDLLFKGNRVYSPSTCCFVPAAINHGIIVRSTKSIVTECKDGWQVQFQKNNFKIFLGVYSTEAEGILAYEKYCESYAHKLAEIYKNKISESAFEKLSHWQYR